MKLEGWCGKRTAAGLVAVSLATAGLIAVRPAQAAIGACGQEVRASDAQVWYSPFIVRVDGDKLFDTISFKAVGGFSGDKAARQRLFERLAGFLAEGLRQGPGLKVTTAVYFDAFIADPASHCACEGRHAYVDFWRAQEPDGKWGFSLWSGCNADSQFAWQEVSRPQSQAKTSTQDEAMPRILGLQVAKTLAQAMRSGCADSSC